MFIIAFFVKLKTRLKRRGDLLFKKNPNVFVGMDIRIQFFESVEKRIYHIIQNFTSLIIIQGF